MLPITSLQAMQPKRSAPPNATFEYVRKRAKTPFDLDIRNSREGLLLLRMALDKLWLVRDRAMMSGSAAVIESGHHQLNRELIEEGGALYAKLNQHIDLLETCEAGICCSQVTETRIYSKQRPNQQSPARTLASPSRTQEGEVFRKQHKLQ